MVQCLSDDSQGSNALQSTDQVFWAMEAVGQTFHLSTVDDAAAVSAAVELYANWVLDGVRPAVITECEFQVIEKVLLQIVPLFRESSGRVHMNGKSFAGDTPLLHTADHSIVSYPAHHLEKRIEICRRVLDIISALGRRQARRLQAETWDVLLRVLITICHSLLQVFSCLC